MAGTAAFDKDNDEAQMLSNTLTTAMLVIAALPRALFPLRQRPKMPIRIVVSATRTQHSDRAELPLSAAGRDVLKGGPFWIHGQNKLTVQTSP